MAAAVPGEDQPQIMANVPRRDVVNELCDARLIKRHRLDRAGILRHGFPGVIGVVDGTKRGGRCGC